VALSALGFVALASPASAAVTFSPSTGNDSTLVTINDSVGCPTGSIEAILGFEGPGSDYLTASEGVVGVVNPTGAYSVQFAIANLRTATSTFGTGPYPQTYDLYLTCVEEVDINNTVIAELTLTGQGATGTTFTIEATGPDPTPTPSTTTTTPATTTTTPATTTTTTTPATTTTTAPTTTATTEPTTTTTGTTTSAATTTSDTATTTSTSGTATTGFTTSAGSTTLPTTGTSGGGGLPRTGAEVAGLVGAGVLLIGGGAAAMVISARRRQATHQA
jgi:hypothetical protein